jgi:hypothetical protein
MPRLCKALARIVSLLFLLGSAPGTGWALDVTMSGTFTMNFVSGAPGEDLLGLPEQKPEEARLWSAMADALRRWALEHKVEPPKR